MSPFSQRAVAVRWLGPFSLRALSSRAPARGARVKPLPHQTKAAPTASATAGLEKLFAGGLDDGTYEVTVYASSQGSRFVLYSGLLGFCLSFVLFWVADKFLILTNSLLLWMGISESLEPYVMEAVSEDSSAVKMLGLTCVGIAAWFVYYMYKQYVGRQIKELTVIRRRGDIFLRLCIFKVQGPPRTLEFPMKKVSCPQLEEMPQSAVESDIIPNASFRAFTLKIESELGFMNEGFWMRRQEVKDRRALWQLFNQDKVPPEHNVWLHFLRAKKPDPTLFPCQ